MIASLGLSPDSVQSWSTISLWVWLSVALVFVTLELIVGVVRALTPGGFAWLTSLRGYRDKNWRRLIVFTFIDALLVGFQWPRRAILALVFTVRSLRESLHTRSQDDIVAATQADILRQRFLPGVAAEVGCALAVIALIVSANPHASITRICALYGWMAYMLHAVQIGVAGEAWQLGLTGRLQRFASLGLTAVLVGFVFPAFGVLSDALLRGAPLADLQPDELVLGMYAFDGLAWNGIDAARTRLATHPSQWIVVVTGLVVWFVVVRSLTWSLLRPASDRELINLAASRLVMGDPASARSVLDRLTSEVEAAWDIRAMALAWEGKAGLAIDLLRAKLPFVATLFSQPRFSCAAYLLLRSTEWKIDTRAEHAIWTEVARSPRQPHDLLALWAFLRLGGLTPAHRVDERIFALEQADGRTTVRFFSKLLEGLGGSLAAWDHVMQLGVPATEGDDRVVAVVYLNALLFVQAASNKYEHDPADMSHLAAVEQNIQSMSHCSQAICALLALLFASRLNGRLGGVHANKLDEVWEQFVERSRLMAEGSTLAPALKSMQDTIRSGKAWRF